MEEKIYKHNRGLISEIYREPLEYKNNEKHP
jgi:hypothetical protein